MQGGDGFVRLTWGAGLLPVISQNGIVTGQVKRLQIVFDEGTTLTGHAKLGFGLAVLDNVNVNGVRVGQGPGNGDDDDDDEGEDDGDPPRDDDDDDD